MCSGCCIAPAVLFCSTHPRMFPGFTINDKNRVLDQVSQHQSTPISKVPLLKVGRENRLQVLRIDGEDFSLEKWCRRLVSRRPFGVSRHRGIEIGFVDDGLDC
jgi:hypothetical protein